MRAHTMGSVHTAPGLAGLTPFTFSCSVSTAPSFSSCEKRESCEQPGRRQGCGALEKPPVLNPTGVSRAVSAGSGQDQDHGERGSAGPQPGPHQRSAFSRALLSPLPLRGIRPPPPESPKKKPVHFPWVLQRGVSRGLQPGSSSVCGWSFL